MAVNQFCSAWRTKPCKFFAETGSCTKGAECRFAHIGEGGNDVHEYFDPNVLDEEIWHEVQDTAALQEDFEEVNLNEVGAMAESCEEGEKDFRLQPHFVIYPGIGP